MPSYLSLTDIAALGPLLILFMAILALLLLESFPRPWAKFVVAWVCVVALALAMVVSFLAPLSQNPLLSDWITFDPLAHFFVVLFMLIGIAASLLAMNFFQRAHIDNASMRSGEYFILLLLAVVGSILMALAADFLILFIGLEVLSMALYILCGYIKRSELSQESSIKYFLMGSLATAFLLYGIALLYGAAGSTNFEALLPAYQQITAVSDKTLFMVGIAFVTMALVFKAAVVPFHAWAPDVYAAAPTPVVAFMATGTKLAAFAALVRVFLISLPQFEPLWNNAMAILSYITLVYANFVALRQLEMRRFFAYSGIAHAGFLLIPLAVGSMNAVPAILFYLTIYALATFVAFAVLSCLDQSGNGVMLSDLTGLFYRAPLLATLFALSLATLAGIPPLVGFFAKFYLFQIAFEAGYVGLVIVGSLTTILAAYYYLRLVVTMSFKEGHEDLPPLHLTTGTLCVGVVSVVTILLLTLYPDPFLGHLDSIWPPSMPK